MLQLFRTGNLLIGLLLIPYAIALRSYGLLNDVPDFSGRGTMPYEGLTSLLPGGGSFAFWLALLLVVGQGLLLSHHTNQYKEVTERSLLPGLCYVLLASLSKGFLCLSPALLGNTFLILGLCSLFYIHNIKRPGGYHFHIGFWFGLATLTYGGNVGAFVYAILSVIIIRPFRFRDFFQVLGGYAVPFAVGAAFVYYRGGSAVDFLMSPLEALSITKANAVPTTDNWLTVSVYAVLTLACILGYRTFMEKKSVRIRKIVTVVFLSLVFTGGSLLLLDDWRTDHLLLSAIPISIMVGQTFHKMRTGIWAEAWHLLLIALLLLSHWVF